MASVFRSLDPDLKNGSQQNHVVNLQSAVWLQRKGYPPFFVCLYRVDGQLKSPAYIEGVPAEIERS